MTRVVSTLWAPGVPAWQDVEVIDRRELSWLSFVANVASAARRCDALVLDGSSRFHDRYRDLVVAAWVARMRRPPAVIIAEAAWDLTSAELRRLPLVPDTVWGTLVKRAVRAIDGDHVTYCVLSAAERGLFSDAFGIDERHIAVTPHSHTLWGRADQATIDGGYIFSGGDSLRDYETLLSALDGCPRPVRLVTNRPVGPVPHNVDVGPVPREAFFALLKDAGPVVLPLRPGRRSAGLMTMLNAMAYGKLVIASDIPGIREYLEPGHTGLVVPAGNTTALREAIRWALDARNSDEAAAMGARAREYALARHPPEAYWASLRGVAERAVGDLSPARD